MKNVQWDKISSFAGIASSLATIVALLFAAMQIKDSNSSRNADFAYRVYDDFFNEESNQLFTLIDNDLLKYKICTDNTDSISLEYFEVDTVRIMRLPVLKELIKKKTYTTYEFDNLIFNHFSILGEYYRKGIISIDYISEGFGYYILSVYNNKEVQKYIKSTNSSPESSNYFGYQSFEGIYQALVSFRKKNQRL